MKHILKDYKVKMYILREFSANQNVVIVGDRNDEDHAVPPVMKLIERQVPRMQRCRKIRRPVRNQVRHQVQRQDSRERVVSGS